MKLIKLVSPVVGETISSNELPLVTQAEQSYKEQEVFFNNTAIALLFFAFIVGILVYYFLNRDKPD